LKFDVVAAATLLKVFRKSDVVDVAPASVVLVFLAALLDDDPLHATAMVKGPRLNAR
jgi:hypothetical protein